MNVADDMISPAAWERIRAEWGLTRRELQVAKLSFAGRKREAIAGQLNIKTGTVRTHLMRLFKKAGVHSAHDLHFLCLRLAKTLKS